MPDLGIGSQPTPSPNLSPRIAQRRAIRGERRKLVGTLTKGGARGSCPSLALGYFLMPFQGCQEEAAASCRCTSRKTSNLQAQTLVCIGKQNRQTEVCAPSWPSKAAALRIVHDYLQPAD
jgi:hypothetical protein